MSRLLADGSLSARTTGLLGLIETPEAMEGYVLRSQGQDDAKRRAQRCITAVQEAARLGLKPVPQALVLHERGVIVGAGLRQQQELYNKAAARTTATRTNMT